MDERDQRDALTAAGYTGLRGAVLFCLLLAGVGGLLGSVVIAIVWNMLAPATSDTLSTAIGAAIGAGLGVLVGSIKVKQGNIEAREQVDDREWRRLVRRVTSDKSR
ncbi:hypothetical protein [Hyphomicrobium sp.]|uniref:hypothetical protein n=1 Tax=Hyphomicrobium sp. TaxID=82 RepID=UPI002E2F4244|nr:hypothetical protein [Hyphomicrobium sp.]HEX2840959.1 hypothetical protein [Hyphomicrobium sp.]